MSVSADAPALDIAYKLTEYAGIGRMKLSPGKRTLPGRKQVFRTFRDGLACGELRETEAMTPVARLAGESRVRLGIQTGGEPERRPSPEEWEADKAIMRRGLDYAARHGITSFHNMDGNLYQLVVVPNWITEFRERMAASRK